MSGLSKKLMLLLIPVIALLIGCLCLLLFLPDKNSGKIYTEQLSTARKLASAGDYEQAIVHFKKAIEEDGTKEEPYIELADIYFLLKRDDEGKAVLQQGYDKIKSQKLLSLMEAHMTIEEKTHIDNGVESPQESDRAVFSTRFTDIFSTYDYKKYKGEMTVHDEKTGSGSYTVTYAQYGAVLEFTDTPENKVIDPKTAKPFDHARPTAIKLKDLSLLIPNVEQGVSRAELEKSGVRNIQITDYDDDLKACLLKGELDGMKVSFACSKEGVVKGKGAYNELIPQPVESGDDAPEKVAATGEVKDATTGKGVASASIKFRSGKGSKTGPAAETAEVVNGSFSVELEPGDYTAEVTADGYNDEFFDMKVSDNESENNSTFTISPELEANEVRFVLEWGSSPADLDSHLDGNIDGTSVHIDFIRRTATKNGNTIADLDVDDRDGHGPETITLYKTNGTVEYRVHRYSFSGSLADSGATVKIYTSGSATPTVVSVPDNVDKEWWTVCTVENGVVKNINGK